MIFYLSTFTNLVSHSSSHLLIISAVFVGNSPISLESNKPRENSERYQNQSGRRSDGSSHKKVNNLELCDESFDEDVDY